MGFSAVYSSFIVNVQCTFVITQYTRCITINKPIKNLSLLFIPRTLLCFVITSIYVLKDSAVENNVYRIFIWSLLYIYMIQVDGWIHGTQENLHLYNMLHKRIYTCTLLFWLLRANCTKHWIYFILQIIPGMSLKLIHNLIHNNAGTILLIW